MQDPYQHERLGQGPARDRCRAATRWRPGTGRVARTSVATALNRPVLAGIGILGAGVAVIALAFYLSAAVDPNGPIVVARNPLIGQPAPEIRLATVDGDEVTLSDLRGRPVIINFWASWCIPCREEFPLLSATYERHAADGLEILGVVHDDGAEAARSFAEAYGADWPLLMDVDDAAWRDYKGAFLPLSYFIDRDGIIRSVSYGPPPADVLEQQIAEIL